MIRIIREEKLVQLKGGTKETRSVEISGFRVKDHVIIDLKPAWFKPEKEVIRIETWRECK